MKTNLSAYTKASNCTDLADVECGLAELKEYLNSTSKPVKYARVRFAKLFEKRKLFQSIEYQQGFKDGYKRAISDNKINK